ncbi:MAG: three-Cys-motif partner protein TcmP [Acidobacteria bacterium]|nr:three-Cys-motif partner protein TcmP [Acidobacteriota bacterium]
MAGPLQFDKIGYWSEVKLEIVRDYASAYSKILTAKGFHHVYIDAFAGAGVHISKATKEPVAGSPLNALLVNPPFNEFFFIDLESQKADLLKQLVGERKDVYIFQGDCNELLKEKVFPKVRWEDYRRGLCLLDPYGLHLDWKVVAQAGKMKTIDMFLNFQVMDMNRNCLWRHPEEVRVSEIGRMNTFWGDDSWRKVAYRTEQNLFGEEEVKEESIAVVNAYCQRLKNIAGFKHVARPLPMRNSLGAIVYYLLFASQKQVAEDIAEDIVDGIFKKYQGRGKQ